ncbi:DUF1826 domain-containing protein [Cohaesibacter gelatinilyticus]|uniref:DUF1826 domain-containing protein n=1 Tax=Cohaesibacter gelatinilyticus TaxID=372072 RepID=A0A285PBF4_9HYPH|nr:DUF1826 domain-containing protein [Cohaesibacter gelatinilyticus]SNZ19055.1 Protein of unknown function [Cohaesibacter gelatinilyticus]
MTQLAEVQVLTAQDVMTGCDAEVLYSIGQPGIAATIWDRRLDPALQDWVSGLSSDRLPEVCEEVAIEGVHSLVLNECEEKKISACEGREAFLDDVAQMAKLFGKVMKVERVKIRLDVADEVMCPRFHLDNVAARLLCTYRGQGTLYVVDALRERPDCYNQVALGSVGLFRGKQWPSDEQCMLVHRSPEVPKGTGPRLLLVFDPIG